LKSDPVNSGPWRTFCAAASLNDLTPATVQLFEPNNNPIGNPALLTLNPKQGVEMQGVDVFAAVGALPINYSNMRAEFLPNGGPGAGVFGVCMIVDTTSGDRAFEVAKYLDDNDDGRQFLTVESHDIVSEILRNHSDTNSNLHLAYFQHPDRVQC